MDQDDETHYMPVIEKNFIKPGIDAKYDLLGSIPQAKPTPDTVAETPMEQADDAGMNEGSLMQAPAFDSGEQIKPNREQTLKEKIWQVPVSIVGSGKKTSKLGTYEGLERRIQNIQLAS